MKLNMNYAGGVALTAAVAAAFVTASAKKDKAGIGGELFPTIPTISHRIAKSVDRVTMADKMRPVLTAKDFPGLVLYVQEMESICNTLGASEKTILEYYKNITSFRLSREEILEHWDILMQPININGEQQKLFMYLCYKNRHFRETISTPEFIDENWELLLGTSSNSRISYQTLNSYEGTLFDEMRVFYHPTFGDVFLKNHMRELIQWHLDNAKWGIPSLSDPLGYWLTREKGIISWNDIAPFQELIEEHISLQPRDRQGALIRLLRHKNIVTEYPLPLPQPSSSEPLLFGN